VPYPPKLQELLDQLNEHQLAAVNVGPGRVCVIGNPGAGKTATVVARIGRLISDGLDPSFVLAMTFTRAAAQEMMLRLTEMGYNGARVGTIHSVCRQIAASETSLFQEGHLDDRNNLQFELKKLLGQLRKEKRIPARGVDRECVQQFLDACKARGLCYIYGDPFGMNIRAEEFMLREAARWRKDSGLPPQKLVTIFEEIERIRAGKGLYTFDDMLLWAWLVLLTDETARSKWRTRWSVVIMDEAQDSNPIQLDIARFLTGLDSCIPAVRDLQHSPKIDDGPHSLMLTGDPSQSVYGWRSAEPKALVRFSKDPNTKQLVLPINYRSNETICRIATELVKHKTWHLGGQVVSSSGEEVANAITISAHPTAEDEAEAAVKACMELAQTDGYRSCAILSRLNVSLLLAEVWCIRHRITYIKMASGSFFESRACKDILAYLRVAAGRDPDGRWARHIINRPFRYIGNLFINKAESHRHTAGLHLLDAMDELNKDLTVTQRRSLRQLRELIDRLQKMAQTCRKQVVEEGQAAAQRAEGGMQLAEERVSGEAADSLEKVGPGDLVIRAMKDTDYLEVLRREEGLIGLDESKVVMLSELTRMADLFRTVEDFLAYTDQVAIAVQQAKQSGLRLTENTGQDALVLATIHKAKGLQWEHVRLVDVSKGRFPHTKSLDLDEERRLLYVAITRAKNDCYVSHVGPTDEHGQVKDKDKSSFIIELERRLEADKARSD